MVASIKPHRDELGLGDGRYAFARASDLEGGGGPVVSAQALEDAMAHAPPAVELPNTTEIVGIPRADSSVMSWNIRPLSAKWVRLRRIAASGSSPDPPPPRRSPPADSTNWM